MKLNSTIIVTWKGAIGDFHNLLTAQQTVSNVFAQVAKVQKCANHMQHIKCLSHATYSVPLGTEGQLSY